MTPITTSTDVARPAQEVFAYVTDPTRLAEWQHGVVGGHMDGEGPHSVGDECVTTRRIGGAERSVTSLITHIDPPTTWGVRAVDGPIRAIVDVTVTPLNEGHRSRVTIELDFTGHGIGKLLVPLMVRQAHARKCPPTYSGSSSRSKGASEFSLARARVGLPSRCSQAPTTRGGPCRATSCMSRSPPTRARRDASSGARYGWEFQAFPAPYEYH